MVRGYEAVLACICTVDLGSVHDVNAVGEVDALYSCIAGGNEEGEEEEGEGEGEGGGHPSPFARARQLGKEAWEKIIWLHAKPYFRKSYLSFYMRKKDFILNITLQEKAVYNFQEIRVGKERKCEKCFSYFYSLF